VLPIGSSAGTADIARDPADIAPPVGNRAPLVVKLTLTATELDGQLDPKVGSTYRYWTFDNKVPGPMLRVRQGDTVEITLKNAIDSKIKHSIDLHAVLGPGGGAVATDVAPGQSKTFTFKAMVPGVYVYHCATPMVAQHIANGMYGLIVVEPEGGLPPVDREFYVMQGEIYSEAKASQGGHHTLSLQRLLDEQPAQFVFNGAVGALTEKHPLAAKVGQTVRVFFGVGGPNFTSSFHIIGEIFDRVYNQGALASVPLLGVQTTTVAPGGATMVEFKTLVPGRFVLVDHALSRAVRGLSGYLDVSGPEDPTIYHEGPHQ
jgi:nitrite reductase (NO-forming)